MKEKLLYLGSLVMASCITFSAYAQQAGKNDPTFNIADSIPGTGAYEGQVVSIAKQSNGKILVAGDFTGFNGEYKYGIARFEPNQGKVDGFCNGLEEFYSASDGSFMPVKIQSIAVQPDDKVVMVGDFRMARGIAQTNIGRLTASGKEDTTFHVGIGFDSMLAHSVAVQANGKIIAVGDFTSYNGTACNKIVRINANGSIDNTFSGAQGFSGTPQKITIQPDGKIIVAGEFTAYNGVASKNIVRINTDGSIDNTFSVGTGFNGIVNAVALTNGGKIVVGGYFQHYNGVPRRGLAMLLPNGTLDNSFDVGTTFAEKIQSVLVQSDGKIVAGSCLPYGTALSRKTFVRFNADGTHDSSFEAGTNNNEFKAEAMIQLANQDIITVGGFYRYDGTKDEELNGIVRLKPNGTRDKHFARATGLNWEVFKIAKQPDGKLLIGGQFLSYYNKRCDGLIRLLPNGAIDNTFYTDTNFVEDEFARVKAILVQPDGKIVIGGEFSKFRNREMRNIVRLLPNGDIDPTFSGSGFAGTAYPEVYEIIGQPDGKIIVRGNFTSYNGVACNKIVRINPDGSIDNSFSSIVSSINGSVSSMAVQANGKLLLGGDFTSFNSTPRKGLLRINTDGTLDTTFYPDRVITVSNFVLQHDGKILAIGIFNGISSFVNLRRFNSNGTQDSSLSHQHYFMAPLFVRGILLLPEDKFFIFGQSISGSYDAIRFNNDGTADNSFSPIFVRSKPAYTSVINTAVLSSENQLLIGGNFNFIQEDLDNKIVRNNIARLHLGNVTVSTKANVAAKHESKLYPNPAREFFNISRKSEQPAQVRIYDMLGKMVQEQTLNGAQNAINIKHLSKGLYLVQLLENNQRETLKLLVE